LTSVSEEERINRPNVDNGGLNQLKEVQLIGNGHVKKQVLKARVKKRKKEKKSQEGEAKGRAGSREDIIRRGK